MKKFGAVGVSLLAVVVAMAMMAGPADARARRHHRHHRHGGGGGGGVVCGPGTVDVGGTCVPTPTPTPVSGCVATNNPAKIQGAGPAPGAVLVFVACSNLTPNITLVTTSQSLAARCQGVAFAVNVPTDNQGNAIVLAQGGNGTTAVCNPGNVTIEVSEAVSPGRTFSVPVTIVA